MSRLHVGGGWRLERDALTAGPQRIWECFLGIRNSLLRDTSCRAEGGNVPSGFGGGLAAWLGDSVFGRLETDPGLWRAWDSLEAGAQTHTASRLDRQLALVKPSPPRLQVGEKECGAEEYMGSFGGKSVGSWAHPPLLSLSLSFSLSLSHAHTHTHTHTHTLTHTHRRLRAMSLCPLEKSLSWQQGARLWRPDGEPV